MSEIAIIGDLRSILPFRALGLDLYDFNPEAAQFTEQVSDVFRKEYKVIYITENMLPSVDEVRSTLRYGTETIVVAIPNNQGSTGAAEEKLHRIVERAVGVDIFAKESESQ